MNHSRHLYSIRCALAHQFLISIVFLTFSILQIEEAIAAPSQWPGYDLNGKICNGPPSNYGPFNYMDPVARSEKLPIVETYHFTKQIQQLLLPNRKSLFSNIGYTLRAFPNHHPALMALLTLFLDEKEKYGPPIECYFNRAIEFFPDDGKVQLLYGIYLHRLKLYDDAIKKYHRAEALLSKSPELYYNMGLLYLDKGDYKNAKKYADKAYRLGHPLKGLKRRLEQESNRSDSENDSK